MGIMVSVAIVLYLLQLNTAVGFGLAVTTAGFWFGYLLLIISDSLDSVSYTHLTLPTKA